MLACRYMVLTNTEIAPLPAPILRSACPLHPRGSPNSRAPPARAPRHIPKPPPTHIPTSPTVPIRVYGGDKHRRSPPPPPPALRMSPAPHSRAPPAPALSPQEGDELHLRPLTAPPNTTRHPRNTCTPTDIQRPRKWSLTGRKWSPKDDLSSRAAAQGTGAERRTNRVMLASDRQVG